MAKKAIVNRWEEHHKFLENQPGKNGKSLSTERKEEICRLCGWSNATFYRKMEKPVEGPSISEKITIAQVYNMPSHFLFPELENQTV
jgi:hypothetical protein